MKYPVLERGKTREWRVEALGGGCNRRDGSRGTPDNQLTAAENLWWQNGALRTRPGLRAITAQQNYSYNQEISWKFCQEDTVRGSNAVRGRRFLQRVLNNSSNMVQLRTGILTYDGRFIWEGSLNSLAPDVTGMVMEYPYTATENVLIFLSNGDIYAQHTVTGSWRKVTREAYVPCLLLDGEGTLNIWDMPSTVGTHYEGRNMLTGRFCAKYTTSATGCAFHFPVQELDEDQPIEISIAYHDGTNASYTIPPGESEGPYAGNDLKPIVDRKKGLFYFLARDGGVTAPLTAFPNNMVVYASKSWSSAEKKRIASMKWSTWFGGSQAGRDSRQFISGASDQPNRIYWSGQGQPLYFPETNYIAVGDINQSITAFGKQDGMLVIFKEREIYSLSGPQGTVSNNLVDGQLVQNATVTSEYFPLTQLHGQIGCLAPHTIRLCGSRLVWADGSGGVYTLIGGSAYNGCHVRELSSLIAPELQAYSRTTWQDASAAVFKGHYLLLVDHKIYALRIDEKAFHRYATVYDDAAAQQQLAWFLWPLSDKQNYLFLSGNGQEAVLLGTRREDLREWNTPLHFEEAMPDNVSWINSWAEQPIISRLCTKEYDLGSGNTKKRILRMRLAIETAQDTVVRFTYLCDGAAATDAMSIQHTTRGGAFYLTPNCARVRRFGCAVEAEGQIAIDDLSWTYRC